MTGKTDDLIQKIADLLRAAKEQDVSELEAEIPYWTTTAANGKITVKAKWRTYC